MSTGCLFRSLRMAQSIRTQRIVEKKSENSPIAKESRDTRVCRLPNGDYFCEGKGYPDITVTPPDGLDPAQMGIVRQRPQQRQATVFTVVSICREECRISQLLSVANTLSALLHAVCVHPEDVAGLSSARDTISSTELVSSILPATLS
mmetsp:Transcript_31087/g.33961  ORF Transcript_31087/g.33961 Transcript_31087/m.33961 type:complete len:148 (+) Transcript_31087:1465-1908(+)